MSDHQRSPCPFGFSHAEFTSLRMLAANAESLRSVAKAHSALLVVAHVIKWLTAFAGSLLVLKGFALW